MFRHLNGNLLRHAAVFDGKKGSYLNPSKVDAVLGNDPQDAAEGIWELAMEMLHSEQVGQWKKAWEAREEHINEQLEEAVASSESRK